MEIENKIKSPFAFDDKAFAPMFDEKIIIDSDEKKAVLPCVVFLCDTGEPLTDAALDTAREDIMLVFRAADWPFVRTVQRGAEITLTNGKKYKAYRVAEDALYGVQLYARGA